MKNIAEYIDFKKGIINELSSLGISELRECMKSIKDEADQANWIEYLRWEVEALDLAENFIDFENNELVDSCSYSNGFRYPDIASFTEERISFYRDLVDNEASIYSDEVLSRYYNVLIQCDKKNGYKYIDYAIATMENLFGSLEEHKSWHYCARIVHLSVVYQKIDVIKKYIEKVREFVLSDIVLKEDKLLFLPFQMRLYSKLVFIKKNVNDHEDNIKEIVDQGIAAIAICNGAYAPTAEYIFDNLLYIANKLKDEEMCKKIKKLRIEKQIKLGDAAMIEGDYYNAAVFYERAASYGNNYGMHSSMNDTLSKLKKANVHIGETTHSTSVRYEVPDSEAYLNEIHKFITGNPDKDFRNITGFVIANILDNSKGFFPDMTESYEKGKKRQSNWIWKFVSIAKMTNERKIAEVSKDEDQIRYFQYDDYVTHLKFITNIWFEQVMHEAMIEGLSNVGMSEQIVSAEWLSDANKYLILEAVKLLSEERYAAFMHVAIPLYECIFRRQFSYHDLATTHIDMNDGSQQEKIFGVFIRSNMVKEYMPQSLIDMSEVVFTDELGLNLRNNIAHGLCEKEDFNKNTAYLVFMMLLMITRFDWVAYGIAEKEKKSEK